MPALLVAMTLVAACFSLRLFRMGGIQRMVLGGVTAGFVLYVASKIVGDLGGVGIVSRVACGLVAGDGGMLDRSFGSAAPGGRLMGSPSPVEHGKPAGGARLRAGQDSCVPDRRADRPRCPHARLAQAPAAGLRSRPPPPPRSDHNPDKLYVDADKIVYDKDQQTSSPPTARRALLQGTHRCRPTTSSTIARASAFKADGPRQADRRTRQRHLSPRISI